MPPEGRKFVLPAPWLDFLTEVDAQLKAPVEIHCMGGFALQVLADLPRSTSDVDFHAIMPRNAGSALDDLAGKGSSLAKKHGLYLQHTTVAHVAEGYTHRLVPVTPTAFHRLTLRCMSAEDIVLSKLTRNSPKDRHDAIYLASRGALDIGQLKHLYEKELRPFALQQEPLDLTFDLWLEEILNTSPTK